MNTFLRHFIFSGVELNLHPALGLIALAQKSNANYILNKSIAGLKKFYKTTVGGEYYYFDIYFQGEANKIRYSEGSLEAEDIDIQPYYIKNTLALVISIDKDNRDSFYIALIKRKGLKRFNADQPIKNLQPRYYHFYEWVGRSGSGRKIKEYEKDSDSKGDSQITTSFNCPERFPSDVVMFLSKKYKKRR